MKVQIYILYFPKYFRQVKRFILFHFLLRLLVELRKVYKKEKKHEPEPENVRNIFVITCVNRKSRGKVAER